MTVIHCGFNANDPDAPEHNKAWKVENHSLLGRSGNVERFKPLPGTGIGQAKKILSQKTRKDFANSS